jgi:protein phosphatase
MIQRSEFSLDFAAATDIGCQRSNNEDSFGYDGDLHLYVVCDGMGGSAAGEVASAMAVRALIESFERQTRVISHPISDSAGAETTVGPAPIEERLSNSIHEANRQVRHAAEADPSLRTMGTTLVCACLDGPRLVIGNVGDSRAYLIRNAVCMQVTLDHSLLDEQVRGGLITQEMANASSLKSVITRAIGGADTVEPDLFAAELNPGDMLLLTSDGLTRYAEPADIASVASPEAELSDICQSLINHAKQRGGVDNITCMILRVLEKPLASDASEADEPAALEAESYSKAETPEIGIEAEAEASPEETDPSQERIFVENNARDASPSGEGAGASISAHRTI